MGGVLPCIAIICVILSLVTADLMYLIPRPSLNIYHVSFQMISYF